MNPSLLTKTPGVSGTSVDPWKPWSSAPLGIEVNGGLGLP